MGRDQIQNFITIVTTSLMIALFCAVALGIGSILTSGLFPGGYFRFMEAAKMGFLWGGIISFGYLSLVNLSR